MPERSPSRAATAAVLVLALLIAVAVGTGWLCEAPSAPAAVEQPAYCDTGPAFMPCAAVEPDTART